MFPSYFAVPEARPKSIDASDLTILQQCIDNMSTTVRFVSAELDQLDCGVKTLFWSTPSVMFSIITTKVVHNIFGTYNDLCKMHMCIEYEASRITTCCNADDNVENFVTYSKLRCVPHVSHTDFDPKHTPRVSTCDDLSESVGHFGAFAIVHSPEAWKCLVDKTAKNTFILPSQQL